MKRAILFLFIALAGQSCRAAADGSVPFRLFRGYLVLVGCSVAEQSGLTAIIDTGTTETILDSRLARRLALVMRPDSATTLTTEAQAWTVSIPNLRIGPVSLNHLDGIAMDLSHIGQALGVHPDLVVGLDVLHLQNLSIDYRARIIRFGDVARLANWTTIAPSQRFILVDSTVLGKALRLKLDTGFNGLLVYGDRLGQGATEGSRDARVVGVAQESGVRRFDSLGIRIGSAYASRVSLSVIPSAPRDVEIYDGLLGPRAFGARRLAFNFAEQWFSWD